MSDPAYLKALKGEMPIQQMGWFKSYKKAFIDTSRFTPIVHIITGVMILGYTIEFASHLRHERHAAQAKRLAAGGHH